MLEQYDVLMGTFGDYLEMVIQFGYATSQPHSRSRRCSRRNHNETASTPENLPAVARVEPTGAEDIGTWQAILESMAVLAVITNCMLISFTSLVFKEHTQVERFALFVTLEHALLGAKAVIAMVINDVPLDVEMQIERSKFLVSKVILDTPDEESDIQEMEEACGIVYTNTSNRAAPDLIVLGNDTDFLPVSRADREAPYSG